MLADYLEAAIPAPTILLGQRLKPFCLGHNLILLRHDCAFLQDGAKTFELGDLLLGVYVCCHTYEEALEAFERKDLAKLMRDWRKKLGPFDVQEKGHEFQKYLRAGSSIPDVLPAGNPELVRTPGAPFLQLVKITLTANLRYTRSEAFNMPLGEALHDYFAYWEREGRTRINGESEKAHFNEDLRKQIESEIAAEAAEKGWHAV